MLKMNHTDIDIEPPEADPVRYVDYLAGKSVFYPLIEVLALAIRIEPHLLRNARMRYLPQSDVSAEMEIWYSPIMRSQNVQACVMWEGIARELVRRLKEDHPRYTDALNFVERNTDYWPECDIVEQQIRLGVWNEEPETVQKGLRRILKTVQESKANPERREWARWIKGALPGLQAGSEAIPEIGWLQQYVAAALGSTGQALDHGSGFKSMPDWLLRALPESKDQILYLRLHPGVLECLKEKDGLPCREIQISLPFPTPLLLTENNGTSRWEGFWPGRCIQVATNLRTLTLQTLTGERFRFKVKDGGGDPREKTPSKDTIILAYQPPDRDLAKRIEELLIGYGMQIQLIEDDSEVAAQVSEESTEPVRLMRLWTPNAADYWRKYSAQRIWFGGQGLLLRTDPNVPLPEGASDTQVFDLSDMEKGLDPEVAARLFEIVQRFLKDSESEPPDKENVPARYTAEQWTEIQRLLEEIDDPETEPPRRLAIGDRLAELGDPRPGVGVREIRVPGGEGIPDKRPEPRFSPQVQSLLDEINDIRTEPPRRLEIGDELAKLGDPRKGVGIDENGLPDIDWVEIPGGFFIYQDGQTIELPTFYISRYPVTNLQFRAFVDNGGYYEEGVDEGRFKKAFRRIFKLDLKSTALGRRDSQRPSLNQSTWNQSNRPRTDVDAYEAVVFCRWLSAMLELDEDTIRLPTEQEWEKAARGKKGFIFPWGYEYRSGFANINEPRDKSGLWNLEQTTAVGMYPQGVSPYGVDDLSGNVWEWCLKKYDNPEVIAPDESGEGRVLRGGSWVSGAVYAQAIYRGRSDPGYRLNSVGFRVLSSLPIR